MSHGFLHSALVFLLCAVIFVPVFQKLGLGSVLGYLVGGIVIGPWGMGWITDVEDIMHVSEFGVVLFLFLVGLELEPKRLWNMRVPIFGLGALQVVLNTGFLFCLGWLWPEPLNWQVKLIAGLGFSLSSTAIALQILKDRNLLAGSMGQSAFSVLLFQDIAVIPMLAILPFLGSDAAAVGDGTSFWLKAAKFGQIIAILVAVVFLGRWTTRPLFRFIASLRLREIFTALALLLVIGMAALMQYMGLSMGLGAFVAGVLLADSEYRHALETDIEPFKGLLLGLFFISVGMSIDLGVVMRTPLQLSLVVAALVLAKLAVHWGLARMFSVPRKSITFFSLLLAQVGEFAFVLFAAAKSAGVLSQDQAATLIAASALSMLVSPILIFAFDRWCAPFLNKVEKPPPDEIENEHPSVIIAGFGRFGQIIGRLLYANGVRATVLDHEPEQIELLRRFGFKVYFGDATREDLLVAAGIREAKILVVAIDNVDEALKLVDLAQREFPHLKIYSRARNVQHLYKLMDRGIAGFERETFEASLRLGGAVLRGMGWPAHPVWRAMNRFRDHNVGMLKELHPIRDNQADMVARAKQARADLENMFEKERSRLQATQSGWD